MDEFSFFSISRISNKIYVVRESFGYDKNLPNSNFYIGVVVGDEKVAVFDAGNGATDGLRRYIEERIPETVGKPMVCFLSHNHLDHIGACMMFDKRYMHSIDINEDELAWATNPDRHFLSPDSDMGAFCQHDPEIMEYVAKHYYKNLPTANDFIPVSDGEIFDLGGVTVKTIFTPGHTRGSCCYYISEEHFLFAGDSVSPNGMRLSPNLIEGESETLWGFKRIKETCAEDTLILDGHNFLNNIDVIDKLSAAFYEVTRGINISRDNSAPPSQFVYKDVNHRHAPVAGVFQMRHWYKDVNVNYNVKVQ